MARDIADYALIGDCETAALVARNGSIDWLCWPRFDSPACCAALLGTAANGYWRVSPTGHAEATRRYRPRTLILETTFKTRTGQITLIDFMPLRGKGPRVTRMVRGDRGSVRVHMELSVRFGYGRKPPGISQDGFVTRLSAGPDQLAFRSSVPLRQKNRVLAALFDVKAGQIVWFELQNSERSAHSESPPSARVALQTTQLWWRRWTSQLKYRGPTREAVQRSLITLKALTYRPTGGMVAAPTTSLPEVFKGHRNWDYRYCWLRDATFTLLGLIHGGYHREAQAWKEWLLRAAGGKPGRLRILYGVTGKTIGSEKKLEWLSGFRGALPVRVGNAAGTQVQLDIFGELADALYQSGSSYKNSQAFRLVTHLLDRVEKIWRRPDHGIWEVRGETQHFTHSKVMCWVAFDRAIRQAEEMKIKAPLEKWRAIRRDVHDSVCRFGFNKRLGAFVQSYGSSKMDASLLLLPLVGFLPPNDERITGTVALIERRLIRRGFVMRREHPGKRRPEGAFLPCSFWLADYYELAGLRLASKRLLKKLLSVRNDVGLLSEEYNPINRRLVGNFPQALSHVALVNTIINLHTKHGPSHQRSSPGRKHPLL